MVSTLKHRSAIIGLGGNQPSSAGPPKQTLLAALNSLSLTEYGSISITATSRFYRSPAYPLGSGPEFVNAAIRLTTSLSPSALLGRLHEIESQFGRQRQSRWAARTLDLDLIAYDDVILPDRQTIQHWVELDQRSQKTLVPDQLMVPHPRLQDRAFVLIPLSDFAAHWRHPLTDETVNAMISALPDAAKAGIRPI
jgi:2-amino-4-hydroxy-6-hydroxymethyldihydropteridine diphosphokinase